MKELNIQFKNAFIEIKADLFLYIQNEYRYFSDLVIGYHTKSLDKKYFSLNLAISIYNISHFHNIESNIHYLAFKRPILLNICCFWLIMAFLWQSDRSFETHANFFYKVDHSQELIEL